MTTNGEQAILGVLQSLERAIVGSEQEGNPGLLERVKKLERNQLLLILTLVFTAGDSVVTRLGWF